MDRRRTKRKRDISCPVCYDYIENIKDLYYNVPYNCQHCDTKFLIIKVPKEIAAINYRASTI